VIAHLIPLLTDRGLRDSSSFSDIYGYSFTAYAIGAAFGPLLMGWSFDRFHSYAAGELSLAAAMLAGAISLGTLSAYRTPEAGCYSKAAPQNS
jgi:MFS family permease